MATLRSSTTYIPLKQAAERYGVPEKTLLERVNSGSIAAAQLPNGELLVAESNVDPSLNIKRENFEHLRGQAISASEASRRYSELLGTTIYPSRFSEWAKAGFIKVLDRGWKISLDEADVAYCATVYKAKYDFYGGQMIGVPIFDQDGNPYQPKHPELAAYKRAIRKKQRQRRKVDNETG